MTRCTTLCWRCVLHLVLPWRCMAPSPSRAAVILALRQIHPGEEISISYIDEEAPLEERRQELADYGFACRCGKCTAEAGRGPWGG